MLVTLSEFAKVTYRSTLKHATLVRAEGGGGSALIEAFVTEKLEAAAGVRQALEAYAKTHPEVIVMQDKFM